MFFGKKKNADIFNFARTTQINASLLEQSVNDRSHHMLTCDCIEHSHSSK